ncbi:MAG: hydroxymethylbilane synthase [Blastomonas sp.]
MTDQLACLLEQRPIRLGTRQSPLALAQAHMAANALRQAHGLTAEQVELVTMVATGDRVQDRALREVGGKALWTRELDGSLIEGRIDAAVHSLKDVETIRDPAFVIAAMLERADPRDMLLGASSLADIAHGARLGTSAPRRAAQMLNARPDMQIVLFRGNVATRMAKLAAGEADVTLLACAGLDRLGEAPPGVRLDIESWLPAPSQGAIGIETLAGNALMRALLAATDHGPTSACVGAERAFLAALGGDCHSPVSAHAVLDDGAMLLRAVLYSADGTERIEHAVRIAPGDDGAAAGLARSMLADAPPAIAALFGKPV